MSFIATKLEAEATGSVAQLYREAKAAFGFIPNLTKVFSHRPEVYEAFENGQFYRIYYQPKLKLLLTAEKV